MPNGQPKERNQGRVIAYVDGFNLYHGLKARKWGRFYWLDIPSLCRKFLNEGQTLVACKYFTARVIGNTNKARRQTAFLEALESHTDTTIIEGNYIKEQVDCEHCGNASWIPKEKMTDVRIATQLLMDAVDGLFDTAFVLSADSDLVPPIEIIRDRFKDLRVVHLCPPARPSIHLARISHTHIEIGRARLNQSQMPDQVVNSQGHTVTRPESWR